MFTVFLVSFLIVLASCAALMLGQFFGRPPIHGRCAPGECLGGCDNETRCELKRLLKEGRQDG